MKDFSHFGVKVRKYPEYNYHAVWNNLKTLRLGSGVAKELPPDHAEFYDVSLGTKCNLECPFCYTNALHSGTFYSHVCDKAISFFGSMVANQKPFQIAIGSQGEPTIHPEFIQFLETIYNLGIVPNYTTNGITLASDNQALLDATEKYCGGVALSANMWNNVIKTTWQKALSNLKGRDININIHYVISDKASVDRFVGEVYIPYSQDVLYFVLLPLMNSGRSTSKYQKEAFDYLLEFHLDWSKIAFGAHFYELLQQQDKIKLWMYPPESFSKNLILSDPIVITKSSFHSEPLLTIEV